MENIDETTVSSPCRRQSSYLIVRRRRVQGIGDQKRDDSLTKAWQCDGNAMSNWKNTDFLFNRYDIVRKQPAGGGVKTRLHCRPGLLRLARQFVLFAYAVGSLGTAGCTSRLWMLWTATDTDHASQQACKGSLTAGSLIYCTARFREGLPVVFVAARMSDCLVSEA
ncbi:hypothetical protein MRX96_012200 [Rhipicephalus microplus]